MERPRELSATARLAPSGSTRRVVALTPLAPTWTRRPPPPRAGASSHLTAALEPRSRASLRFDLRADRVECFACLIAHVDHDGGHRVPVLDAGDREVVVDVVDGGPEAGELVHSIPEISSREAGVFFTQSEDRWCSSSSRRSAVRSHPTHVHSPASCSWSRNQRSRRANHCGEVR